MEFDRLVEIPVKYGDSCLILEYFANGGDENLVCFCNYFDDGDLEKKTVKELLSKQT